MSSGSTSWSSQGNTKAGSSVTTDIFTDTQVTGDLTILGNKLSFENGAIITNETGSYLEFSGENGYSFRADAGTNNLTLYLGASNFAAPCGWSNVISHTTGTWGLNNNESGSYASKLTLTKDGVLAAYGDVKSTAGNLVVAGATKGIQHISSGTVTQGTSITTAVTCNATSGIITMYATGIAADENIEFTVNNTTIETDSLIFLQMQDENTVDNTQLVCATHTIAENSFIITVANTDSGQDSSDTANKIHFLVINAA